MKVVNDKRMGTGYAISIYTELEQDVNQKGNKTVNYVTDLITVEGIAESIITRRNEKENGRSLHSERC